MKIKNSSDINLVYIKKVDINKIELMISLTISEFKN